MWRQVGGDSKRALLKASGHAVPRESVEQFGDRLIEKANAVELGRMIVSMSMAEELMVPSCQPGKPDTMLKLADVYGIDVKTIRDGLKAEATSSAKHQPHGRKGHAVA
jgi:hypothetical protein